MCSDDDHETLQEYLAREEEARHAWIQVGTVVDYHAIIDAPPTEYGLVVREPAQQLPSGLWVCWLKGKAGCIYCGAVTPTIGSKCIK